MHSEKILRPLALLAVLAVIGSAFYLMLQPAEENPSIGEHVVETVRSVQYVNETYGLTFSYPDTYVLSERDAEGNAMRAHHTIVLMDKNDAASIPANGEGPTTISIDIFGNGIDKQTVEAWIKNSSNSNFKLSIDDVLASTTLSGVPGFSYTWDGLYRGESTVVSNSDDILMFSVTYRDSTDVIREDFRSLLRSTELQ